MVTLSQVMVSGSKVNGVALKVGVAKQQCLAHDWKVQEPDRKGLTADIMRISPIYLYCPLGI